MATQMLHAGIPLVTVSRRLDHRRISTTLDRYAHAIPGGNAHASATLWHLLETATDNHDLHTTDRRSATPG
jgi:hypothetical protein